ncbi:MAG: DeoR/GlpR family DNA-binding transcription regulator [Chloroflexota bacterium]|nr:DeoR/GlpR family DNA-binding transcription regulator [Chloroflexota bacterium]
MGEVFARERQNAIAQIVARSGRARVSALSAQFGVSGVTIRKDLIALETEGRVIRAHGGAIAVNSAPSELAFSLRERMQRESKTRIGAAAAALVEDGETIAVDASTTGLYLVRHLKGRAWTQLTVVTNGIRIASELAGEPGIIVLVPGGRLRWEAMSFVGHLGDGLFRRINVGKAMLGAAGISVDAGLTDATEEEAQIKRAMASAAREVIAIVDHTKWGKVAVATFCKLDQLSRIVTDDQAPQALVDEVASLRIVVTRAATDADARGSSERDARVEKTAVPVR